MNLDQARLALLIAPTTPLWTGTVGSYAAATFELTVVTVSGAFPTDISNLLLARAGVDLARVRSRDTLVLTLAENPVEFTAGDTLALYAARLPWPRYQRIVSGVVYKDFDIAFPTPWQAELPPTPVLKARISPNDWQEAIYCQTGDTISLDASASFANLDDGDPLSFAWAPGAGGAITGGGATVTCKYTTAGFRYLTVTVTDAHSTAVTRYLPVWVGDANIVAGITRCSGRWDTRSGWTVDLEMTGATTLLQYGPAAVVDIETAEVIFFGFIVPNSRSTTFETTTTTLTLQSALAFSRYLHAYPFLVTEVTGVAEPDNWAELYEPTLARALWFLLYWHSTLPEVANCDLSLAPARSIAGQEFTLGTLPQQMDAILKSAFWQARGNRAGGFSVRTDPLFLSAALWAGLVGLDLTAAANLRDRLDVTFAEPTVNQARLGGVFQDTGGTFAPALVQAPAAPGPWGSPQEVNNLAPVSAAELRAWAGRYIAVENTADDYQVTPGLPVDPATYLVADLPGSVRVAVEKTNLDFDPTGLRWQARLSGRTYGRSVSAVDLPQPPAIVYPPPELPPFLPPIWDPIPDDPLWPRVVWAATINYGVYRTDDFTSPDDGVLQPTWMPDNVGLPDMSLSRYKLEKFGADPADVLKHCCIVVDTDATPDSYTLYARTNAGTWAAVRTEAQIESDVSASGAVRLWDAVYDAEGGSLWLVASRNNVAFNPEFYIGYSGDNGATWDYLTYTPAGVSTARNARIYVRGSEIALAAGINSSEFIVYSANTGGAWDREQIANSLWTQPSPVLTLGGKLYVSGSSPNDNNVNDLLDVDKATLALTVLQDTYNIGPQNADALWEDPADALHGRILKRHGAGDSKLWITLDGWTTLEDNTPAVYTPDMLRLFCPHPDAPEVIFLGQNAPGGSYPHTLYIQDDEDGIPLERSGDYPDTFPYTGSIPETCGGLCAGGLAVVL